MSSISPELVHALNRTVDLVKSQRDDFATLKAQHAELEQFVAALPSRGGGAGHGQSFGAAAVEALQKSGLDALRGERSRASAPS